MDLGRPLKSTTDETLEMTDEILQLFKKNIKNDFALIKNFYDLKNEDALLKAIHKLHGALCYCNVPKLKKIVIDIETELKNKKMDRVPDLLKKLEIEIQLLLSMNGN